MLKDGFFTAEDDITETLPDGREILLVAKGVQVPEAVAREKGLIGSTQTRTFETKDGARGVTPNKIVETGVPSDAPVARGVTTTHTITDAGLANESSIPGDTASGLTVAGPNPDLATIPHERGTLITGAPVDDARGVVEADHSEPFAIGSNATNPRARGANRRS